jgi:hypothetical protein
MFDYNRVQYSQLKRDFIDIQAIASGRPNQLQIDDANEFHGGAEYRTQFGKRAVALRGGAWWDPDHTVRYLETAHDEVDRLYSATLPGGKDLMHYTFGGAIAVSMVVIDVGADLSSQSKSATASLLVRF